MSDEQQISPSGQQALKVPHCHQNERAVVRCIKFPGCLSHVVMTEKLLCSIWLLKEVFCFGKNRQRIFVPWKLPRMFEGVGSPLCPRAAFLRRRDRLRFPMVLTVIGTMRGFWRGQTSEERQSYKLFLPCYFIRNLYLSPSIIWKMWFIQLYKVWTVSQGILGAYALHWNFQIY